MTGPAFADDLSNAKATLDQAEADLAEVSAEYEQIQKEIDETQTEIDSLVGEVVIAQDEVYEGQLALGDSCRYSYKVDGSSSFLSLILGSDNIVELFRNFQYVGYIQSAQAEEIEAQKERKRALDLKLQELDEKRDEQEVRLAEAEAKKTEAEKILADAEAEVSRIEDEKAAEAERERIAAMKAQAEAMEPEPEPEVDIDKGWNTDKNGHPQDNNPQPVPDTTVDSNTSESDTGWHTGIASAYGGSTDPSTGPHSTTATGAACNDSSVGVAIPMSWPNYRSYLGRHVEISYGGKTVVAVVNDCGYMGGGSRSLDLQPGVWRQFGFSSCNDWGVREVSYRFI